jgi:hypothetical protein
VKLLQGIQDHHLKMDESLNLKLYMILFCERTIESVEGISMRFEITSVLIKELQIK